MVWQGMDLYHLRVGDLVIREIDSDARTKQHIGEVISVRARVRYFHPEQDWREWWDVHYGTQYPYGPWREDRHCRLIRAEVDQLDRLGLR